MRLATSAEVQRSAFPYFGNKDHAAPLAWQLLGDPDLFVEPCCGSARVLLHRPSAPRREIINDIDGFVCNFWRVLRFNSARLARMLDRPSHEIDLQAIHRWLCDVDRKSAFIRQMRSNHRFYDVEIAAYWTWGMSLWWGHGFCEGEYHGDWSPHTRGTGLIRSKRIDKLGQGIQSVRRRGQLQPFIQALAHRLQGVHAMCGDWRRALSKVILSQGKVIGVFFDPPYAMKTGRAAGIYNNEMQSTAAVQEWCLEHGVNPRMRIVLAGFDGEYQLPGWSTHRLKKRVGMARTDAARQRQETERLWVSPHCLRPELNN